MSIARCHDTDPDGAATRFCKACPNRQGLRIEKTQNIAQQAPDAPDLIKWTGPGKTGAGYVWIVTIYRFL
jgi:hypothetical protein